MRQLNSASLMKLGWRFKIEPGSLWARILQDKYCRGRDLEGLSRRVNSASNAWRGVLDMIDLLNRGTGVAIGDGRHTNFWTHKWLDGKILLEHTRCPVPEHLHSARVHDFWLPDSGWDWQRLSQFLPSDTLQRIASYALANEELGDQPVWLGGRSGELTTKSAIQLLQSAALRPSEPSEPIPTAQWEWVWKIRVPYRIQVFVWLILHRKLLTNLERFKGD